MTRFRSAMLLVGLSMSATSGFAPAPQQTYDVVEGRVVLAGQPVAGAVVYLVRQSADSRDPDTEIPAVADTVILDQRSLTFLPRTLAIRPGTTVRFLNSDFILHNVFSPGRVVGVGEPFDLGTYARGAMRYHTFLEEGAHTILCNVHPEMVAYVVSVPAEHRAVTGPDGRFAIADVLSGRYTLRVWHPQSSAYQLPVRVRPDSRPLTISLDPGD